MTPQPAPETGPLLGKLSLDALPLHEPILIVTFIVVALGGLAVLWAITRYRLWGYLWKEWFTTVDHKRIGRSEEHTSELQSLMRISYAVFCLKKKKTYIRIHSDYTTHITRY